MTAIMSAAKHSLNRLRESLRQPIRFWSPAVIAAAVAWLILLVVGETPLSRASGLALAILGVTASMRRMGFIASIGGGLTLAFSPIFWSQTGGGVTDPATIVLATGLAAAAMIASTLLFRREYLGIGLGIVVFVSVFWSQLGTAQSLRLTGLVTAWMIYLIVDLIMLSNPRPGTKPPRQPKPYHTYGLLFLLVIGALNDPLVVLFAPAIVLSLFLSYARLPTWYWLLTAAAIAPGVGLLFQSYLLPQSGLVNLWGWRDALRWIALGQLLIAQFSILGIALGVIGLARLSRWYPPLGTVLITAYAAYTCFGLVYEGAHREVLLLPLVMIQVLWMTYAVNAFGQWINKTMGSATPIWTHLVSAIYLLAPVVLLWNIIQS